MDNNNFLEKLKQIHQVTTELIQQLYQENYENNNNEKKFRITKNTLNNNADYPIYLKNNSEHKNKKLFKLIVVNGKRCNNNDQSQKQENLQIKNSQEENGISLPTQPTNEKELKEMLLKIPGISINSKPRKDGRFQGYVTDDDGNKLYVYGRTQEELFTKLNKYIRYGLPKKSKKIKSAIIKGPNVNNIKTAEKISSPTLKEWGTKWFELYKKPNLKPKSIESIKYSLKYIFDKFGDKQLHELNTDELQEFFLNFKAERRRDMCIAVLRSILEKAKKRGMIATNACDSLEIKAHTRKKKKGLNPNEQSTLLNAVKGTTLEPIFTLLLTGGFRIGELLALRAEDVDFKKNTICVNKNVVFVDDKRIVQTTKTEAGNRTIPLPAYAIKFIPKKKKGDLFPQTYNAIRCAFKRLQQKTGITVSAHILRHTYANRLEEAGIPPKIKQYLMGHASLDITQNVYTDTQEYYVARFTGKILDAFPENPDTKN